MYTNALQHRITNNTTNNNSNSNIIPLFPNQPQSHSAPHKYRITNHSNGTTQPIKNKSDIEKAKSYFLSSSNTRFTNSNSNLRNYCLFIVGLNFGRRIGDILQLKISDFTSDGKTYKQKITIVEQKTKKKTTIFIHPNVIEAVKLYLNSFHDTTIYTTDKYLFESRSINTKHHRSTESKPITRNMAWKIMNDMGKELGLEHIGTHSLRKTKGYQYLIDNKDDMYAVAKVSKAYNHSSLKVTYDYLGFDDAEMKDFYMNNGL